MMVTVIPEIQNISFCVFEFLTIKLNYTQTGASKVSQCFLIGTQPLVWASWVAKLGGTENGTAEGKVRSAAGQTEPALFPSPAPPPLLQVWGCSLGRVPPLERSQQAHGACCSV